MKDWQQRLMGKAMTVMCEERIQIKEIHVLKTNKNNTQEGVKKKQKKTNMGHAVFQVSFFSINS